MLVGIHTNTEEIEMDFIDTCENTYKDKENAFVFLIPNGEKHTLWIERRTNENGFIFFNFSFNAHYDQGWQQYKDLSPLYHHLEQNDRKIVIKNKRIVNVIAQLEFYTKSIHFINCVFKKTHVINEYNNYHNCIFVD